MVLADRSSRARVSTPARPLGVAVVGLGVGEQHAQAYAESPACALRWVYDLDAARMQAVVQRLGQGKAAEGLDQVLADPAVDIVSIASFDDAHFEQVAAALRAGKHVFVEKPLCRSVTEAREIKALWGAHRRQLTSNLVLRGAALYRWLKQAIEAGEFGELYAFDGDYLYGRVHKITEGWRKDVADYSVMQGGGVHLVDLMLWLTGQRPTRVAASGNRLCTEGTAFRYLDYVAATYHFASGLIGRITANFGCTHRHQHVVRLFGTKATFIYDDQGPRLHLSRNPAALPKALDLATQPSSKGVLIPAFVERVVNGVEAQPHAQREFDLISACTAADDALAAGTTREIAYA